MSKLDDLDVIKTIGHGVNSKVKLVKTSKTNEFFAAKIIKHREDSLNDY